MIVKRVITVDYGHNLPEYFGACKNNHGHLGRIICSFEGAVNSSSAMLEDFSYLKEIMMREIHAVADHCYIIWKGDTQEIDITKNCTMICNGDLTNISNLYIGISNLKFLRATGKKILVTDDPPTAETLAKYFGEKVRMAILDKPFYLHSLEWWETPNNCAVYFPGEDIKSFNEDLLLKEKLSEKGY